MTKVINFFAGPGAGKSTTAAGLFFEMKCLGLKVELVTEYAKELAYAGLLRNRRMANAWTTHKTQCARQELLRGKVDFIITDSPLIKDISYAHLTLRGEAYINFCLQASRNFDTWDNYNVWVLRDKPYQPYGRRESEESARAVDTEMRSRFESRMHMWLKGNREAPALVLGELQQKGWC